MIIPNKLPNDTNERAHRVAKLLTGEAIETPVAERSAVSLYLGEIGRNGGLKGGKVRAKNLSKKRRTEIARKAATVRWARKEA